MQDTETVTKPASLSWPGLLTRGTLLHLGVFGGNGVYFYELVGKKNPCGIRSLGKLVPRPAGGAVGLVLVPLQPHWEQGASCGRGVAWLASPFLRHHPSDPPGGGGQGTFSACGDSAQEGPPTPS